MCAVEKNMSCTAFERQKDCCLDVRWLLPFKPGNLAESAICEKCVPWKFLID